MAYRKDNYWKEITQKQREADFRANPGDMDVADKLNIYNDRRRHVEFNTGQAREYDQTLATQAMDLAGHVKKNKQGEHLTVAQRLAEMENPSLYAHETPQERKLRHHNEYVLLHPQKQLGVPRREDETAAAAQQLGAPPGEWTQIKQETHEANFAANPRDGGMAYLLDAYNKRREAYEQFDGRPRKYNQTLADQAKAVVSAREPAYMPPDHLARAAAIRQEEAYYPAAYAMGPVYRADIQAFAPERGTGRINIPAGSLGNYPNQFYNLPLPFITSANVKGHPDLLTPGFEDRYVRDRQRNDENLFNRHTMRVRGFNAGLNRTTTLPELRPNATAAEQSYRNGVEMGMLARERERGAEPVALPEEWTTEQKAHSRQVDLATVRTAQRKALEPAAQPGQSLAAQWAHLTPAQYHQNLKQYNELFVSNVPATHAEWINTPQQVANPVQATPGQFQPRGRGQQQQRRAQQPNGGQAYMGQYQQGAQWQQLQQYGGQANVGQYQQGGQGQQPQQQYGFGENPRYWY